MIKTVGSEKYFIPITQQVCSFERAVQLKSEGYPQNTYFYYAKYKEVETPSLLCGNRFPEDEWVKYYAAYTKEEMEIVIKQKMINIL